MSSTLHLLISARVFRKRENATFRFLEQGALNRNELMESPDTLSRETDVD